MIAKLQKIKDLLSFIIDKLFDFDILTFHKISSIYRLMSDGKDQNQNDIIHLQ